MKSLLPCQNKSQSLQHTKQKSICHQIYVLPTKIQLCRGSDIIFFLLLSWGSETMLQLEVYSSRLLMKSNHTFAIFISFFIVDKLRSRSNKTYRLKKTDFPVEQRSVQISQTHFLNRLSISVSSPGVCSEIFQWSFRLGSLIILARKKVKMNKINSIICIFQLLNSKSWL